MKKLIEGAELYDYVPNCHSTGIEPIVRLQHNLILDDGNCFQSPTLIEGSVGSGKTTLMKELMTSILTYTDKVQDNSVIFCAKPDMLNYRRPEDAVISITSKDAESCWNIFAEMDESNAPMITLREIASALFAKAKEKTTQLFFPEAAQDIFYQTCRYMYDFSKRKKINVSNGDLVEFLETTPIRGNEEIPGWMELSEMHPKYFSMIRDYIGNGTEQGLGVLSELRTLISSTLYGSFASNNGTFSAIRTLKDGGKRTFLYYDYANAGHSTLSVLHVILDLLLKQAMNADNIHKTWFFLDESSLLPKSNVLTDALSFGRDPGTNGKGGVRIIMALQSARLMTHHYTQQEAETLLSLFPNVIAMRVSDSMSRSIVSERYGKAHYQYSYAGLGDKIHYIDSFENVISDFHFSKITKKGQAIISMPEVCNFPFIYNGFKGQNCIDNSTKK
jgi:hypothetical protein